MSAARAKPIEPVMELSACAAPEARSASQRRPGEVSIAWKTVWECRLEGRPRASTDFARLSEPQFSR
jgi:hypothetical protein